MDTIEVIRKLVNAVYDSGYYAGKLSVYRTMNNDIKSKEYNQLSLESIIERDNLIAWCKDNLQLKDNK